MKLNVPERQKLLEQISRRVAKYFRLHFYLFQAKNILFIPGWKLFLFIPSYKQTKVMTNNHQRHQQGDQSKRTEAWVSHKVQVSGLSCIWRGFQAEILSRIEQTTAALTRLKPVWNDRSISLSSKIQLMHSLVTFIPLYVCESWTLTEELQRRIRAMEMRCYRKILRIS